jgi:hypothetical protein
VAELLMLAWCAIELGAIRRFARGCYYELNTARWEAGRRLSGLDKNGDSVTPLVRELEDLLD